MTFGDHQTFYESGKLFTQTSSNTPGLGSSKLARLNRWLHHWSNVRPRLFTLSPSRWNVLYRVRIYDALSSHGVLASFTRARSIHRYWNWVLVYWLYWKSECQSGKKIWMIVLGSLNSGEAGRSHCGAFFFWVCAAVNIQSWREDGHQTNTRILWKKRW